MSNPYDILFESVRIGPVTAPNRFFQVPHCNGFGYRSPRSHARKMDKQDIRNLRNWHRDAALRAKRAGFDVIYVYALHSMSIAMHFIMRRYNDRTDEYSGSLENRARLLRELVTDTKDAVGDRCAVAVRFSVDELLGDAGITFQGEGHDVIAILAELPDLWDITLSNWNNDSATSRFEQEGYQETYTSFVKKLTTKPVVGVGRYTSPNTMVSLVKRGVLDFIGAARPSIADPYLPQKIREGRIEDIRECIGCNICVSADTKIVPIRCTQNPTMGEEWRRGWRPEHNEPKTSDAEILVVGAGAAGLECVRALGQRGYRVALAEARKELGGRVALESRLPGLNEWRRVMDWRMTQIKKMSNVALYPASEMSADDILEIGYRHFIVATGAHWRRDAVGRASWLPIPGHDAPNVFTPDDLLECDAVVLVTDRLPNDTMYLALQPALAEKNQIAARDWRCRSAGHPRPGGVRQTSRRARV